MAANNQMSASFHTDTMSDRALPELSHHTFEGNSSEPPASIQSQSTGKRRGSSKATVQKPSTSTTPRKKTRPKCDGTCRHGTSCKYDFASKKDLKRHLLEGPLYQCNLCGKSFTRGDHLLRHQAGPRRCSSSAPPQDDLS